MVLKQIHLISFKMGGWFQNQLNFRSGHMHTIQLELYNYRGPDIMLTMSTTAWKLAIVTVTL